MRLISVARLTEPAAPKMFDLWGCICRMSFFEGAESMPYDLFSIELRRGRRGSLGSVLVGRDSLFTAVSVVWL